MVRQGLQLTELVERPNFGCSGKKTNLWANFFPVTLLPESNIIHYNVDIKPEVPPPLNRIIYEHFTKNIKQKAVFDGRKNIFSPKPLPLNVFAAVCPDREVPPQNAEALEDAVCFDVRLPPEGDNSKEKSSRLFTVRINRVAEINMEVLIRFLEAKGQQTSACLTGEY